MYRYADVIAAIATDMTADLARNARLNPARITAIAVGRVLTPAAVELLCEQPNYPWLDENDDVPVVLGVGRTDCQQDFLMLLWAFKYLRAPLYCRLLILGEGPLRKELGEARAASPIAGDIALPELRIRPFSYTAECEVFARSSRYEGHPDVLGEALARRPRMVSTDSYSGLQEVPSGGRDGRLVPAGDAERMAMAILATLNARFYRNLARARGDEFSNATSAAPYIDALLSGGLA